jgi:excisionase family DNA binding protein
MMSVMSELSGVRDMSGMLDVADVAPVLGLSEPTVRRMAAAGRLPYYRPGHAYKFDPVDLAEFIQKSRSDGADAAEGAAGSGDLAKSA